MHAAFSHHEHEIIPREPVQLRRKRTIMNNGHWDFCEFLRIFGQPKKTAFIYPHPRPPPNDDRHLLSPCYGKSKEQSWSRFSKDQTLLPLSTYYLYSALCTGHENDEKYESLAIDIRSTLYLAFSTSVFPLCCSLFPSVFVCPSLQAVKCRWRG